MNMGRGTGHRWMRIAGLLVLVAVAALMVFGFRGRWRDPRLPELSPQQQLELARAALDATESLQAFEADQHWQQLFARHPKDTSIALNRAINRLLRVDQLVGTVDQPMLDPQQQAEAARQLPASIDAASAAIAALQPAGVDAGAVLWLAGQVDFLQASRMEGQAAAQLRRRRFDQLAESLSRSASEPAGSAPLCGQMLEFLDALRSPARPLDHETQTTALAALRTHLQAAPHNLYLALRAAQLGIATEQADTSADVELTAQLSRAIRPVLQPLLEPMELTPHQLAEQIIAAIHDDDWQTADNRMSLWFNLLNGTELVKTDRRRATPHPLDRLDFAILRRLSAEVAAEQPVETGQHSLAFNAIAQGPEDGTVEAIALDIDLDLQPEIVSLSGDGRLALWRRAEGAADADALADWTQISQLDLAIECRGLLAADLFMVDATDPQRIQISPRGAAPPPSARHTTVPTLVVYGPDGLRLVNVDGRPQTEDTDRLTPVEISTGLEGIGDVSTMVVGDLDADGDLDLVVATRDAGLRFFINRGNRTFFELDLAERSEAFAELNDVTAMAIVDLDRDLDLDIVTARGTSGEVGLVENLLHLQFRYRPLDGIPAVPGAREVHIGDFDGNVSWDLFVAAPGEAAVAYSHTPDAGLWQAQQSERLTLGDAADPSTQAAPGVVADFDNDSWQQWLVASGDAMSARRLGGDHPELAVEVSGGRIGPAPAAVDFDLDGRLDLLSVVEGRWTLHRNQTRSPGHHLLVRMRGIDDNNPASGRINHYAIGSVVELRFGPHYRAAVVTSPATHFGLDGFAEAGSLRAIFPNGLTQTVRQPPVDTVVEEEQTLKGSCPYLYAWDGQRFGFVTDCLWAAPLGLQVAQGVVAQDRPWEYLKVDGRLVAPRDGAYELSITEELWEVAYFDQVALQAVDSPADVEVWTNEKVGPAEIAEPTVHAFAASDRLPLRQALDTTGEDVTDLLSQLDGRFVQGFDRRLRQGLCPPHWVDLDFGPLPGDAAEASKYLVITGWILPTDTSLNIQIDQNPDLAAIEFPSVWVPDDSQPGGWRNEVPFMGFPGGKTKTIVVDVSDAIRLDDPRLRVRTSAQIYWDAAQLVVQRRQPEVVSHELSLLEATLGDRGFSEKFNATPRSPQWYDYDRVTRQPLWPPLRGRFTRYGDCRDLVERWDDMMVVMGAGDELRLRFSVPDQPPPPGWKRDFILHCVGWDKDADLNTLEGQSSEPLPFRAMTAYPPPHDQQQISAAVMRANAGHLLRQQRFRDFWSR